MQQEVNMVAALLLTLGCWSLIGSICYEYLTRNTELKKVTRVVLSIFWILPALVKAFKDIPCLNEEISLGGVPKKLDKEEKNEAIDER